MGISLGHGFPGPTDAMPGIGLPVAEGPAEGEWCGRHLWVPGTSSSTALAILLSEVLRANSEAVQKKTDTLAEQQLVVASRLTEQLTTVADDCTFRVPGRRTETALFSAHLL